MRSTAIMVVSSRCWTGMRSGKVSPGDLGLSKEDREEHAEEGLLPREGPLSERSDLDRRPDFALQGVEASAREVIGEDRFIEVYVRASLSTCEKRDPKGLYAKARRGEIDNMTGIQAPYEEPLSPDVVLDTEMYTAQECVERLLAAFKDDDLLANGSDGRSKDRVLQEPRG